MSEKPLPKRLVELMENFAMRIMIEKYLRRLALPVNPDKPKEIKDEAKKWKELLSYFPESHHYKIPSALALMADDMREERNEDS